MKKSAIILLLFLLSLVTEAQNTRGTLGVTHFERDYRLSDLLTELRQAKQDTFKARLLEKISSIYWRNNVTNSLDSCIYYARKSMELSQQIHFAEGRNEAIFLQCKGYTAKNDLKSAKDLLNLVYGEMRIRLLLVLGEYYTFLPEQQQSNLDMAYPYIVAAGRLADSIHSVFWKRYCLLLSGKYYFERGDNRRGKKAFFEIIDGYKKNGDIVNEAYYWSEFGLYLPLSQNAYPDKIHAFTKAHQLFTQQKKGKDAAYALRDLAETHMIYNHLGFAEKEIVATLAEHARLDLKPSANTYLLAGKIFTLNGNFDKGISYINQSLKEANPASLIYKMDCYVVLATIYSALEKYQASFHYNKALLDFCLSAKLNSTYTFVHRMVLDQIALGQAKIALSFLKAFQAAHPPTYLNDKELMALSFGNVFAALGEYDQAERYYLQMIAFDKKAEPIRNRQLQHAMDNVRVNSAEVYFTMGSFYVMRKRFKVAGPFLNFALKLGVSDMKIPVIASKGELEYQLYKVDSAAGSYQSALKHYYNYAGIKDSVLKVTKTKQIEKLQFSYESKQKEQSIKLLKSQGLRKDRELQQLNRQRNLILSIAGLLVVIVILAISGYRNNRRRNRSLQMQQEKINAQNEDISLKNNSLESLLNDKDALIRDKDLLLKELNHRVKNNLQMVISLLNKQVSYLHDESAVSAIRESKNRIQAMALIHQKLYNSPDIGAVNMKDYILDLSMYLGYSLNVAKHHIRIKQLVEVERLDISQVVCLGLIINEAITNSVKHAFIDHQSGIINVSLIWVDHENICLKIEDNGIGLPPGFEIKKGNSLGVEMLLGLSKQLGGSLEIKTENGLIIMVTFKEFKSTGNVFDVDLMC